MLIAMSSPHGCGAMLITDGALDARLVCIMKSYTGRRRVGLFGIRDVRPIGVRTCSCVSLNLIKNILQAMKE